MKTISAEDAATLWYFIIEKDDVTRWCDWESKKAELLALMPELDDFLRAQRVADALKHAVAEKLRKLEYT